jgi:D-amino-acid dehydrogenase
MHVVIVGGGAIGLSSALYLAQAGAKVTLIERDQLGRGCSFANAGLVVPSYSIPLANPQSLINGLRWMFKHSGPFTISSPLNPALLSWLLRFTLACTPGRVKASSEAMRAITTAGHTRFVETVNKGGDFGFGESGWLYLYRSDSELRKETQHAAKLQALGIEAHTFGRPEVERLEPHISPDIKGGVYYPSDAHLSPYKFTSYLADKARSLGVQLIEGEQLQHFDAVDGRVVAAYTQQNDFFADHFVIAAGSWTPSAVKSLIGSVPIQPARGFSLTYPAGQGAPARPLMFGEAHVIARPFGEGMRLTGGLELAGFAENPNPALLARIRQSVGEYLSFDATGTEDIWFGYRPLTPDSLPIIGPTKRFPNLFLASGHGTLGMTLSLITGELIMQMVAGKHLAVDISRFSPSRFGI